MSATFKIQKHTWIIGIIGVSLSVLLFFILPDYKVLSKILAGLGGLHLLIALVAIIAGSILIYHKKSAGTVKADYGQDMPGIIIITAIVGMLFITLAIVLNHHSHNQHLFYLFVAMSALFFTISLTGIWNSRYGKIKLRNKVMSCLTFKGSENILDIGCGKGLLLMAAAKRIPNGKATGADTWDKTIEYNYTAQMALKNADIEGVLDHVQIVTADVQSMPFESNSYDMVMTSLMMHHVPDTIKAVDEMIRVTKPGGTLVIADVNSKRFIQILEKSGFMQVKAHYATRLFFIPAYVVVGIKPF